MIASQSPESLSQSTLLLVVNLDDGLLASMRSFGVSATLLQSDGGVILEGVASSYYGKQMAQELARGAKLVVIANRIRVERV
jgi:hypothetical protein